MLTGRQEDLLREAARRYLKFNRNNKPITECWTGLGFKTDYKPVLDAGMMEFLPLYVPRPRCMSWLVLTEKGAAIVQKWLDDGLTLADLESGTSLEQYSLVGYRG